MSAIDNSEVTDYVTQHSLTDSESLAGALKHSSSSNCNENKSEETYRIRKPKRILHFSDGTLEEYDSDSDNENDHKESEHDAMPAVDPKTLSWPAWFQHYTTKGAQRTLDVLDSTGEIVAYYLGITTPKYQYELDEYNRMKEDAEIKQREREEELSSWGTLTIPDKSTTLTSAPVPTTTAITAALTDVEPQVPTGHPIVSNSAT